MVLRIVQKKTYLLKTEIGGKVNVVSFQKLKVTTLNRWLATISPGLVLKYKTEVRQNSL